MKSILKQILSIMEKHTMALIIIAVASIFCMAESFLHPIIVQRIMDQGLIQREYKVVMWYVCILIILILTVQGVKTLQEWLLIKVRNDVLHKLHVQAFQKVLRLNVKQFTEQNSTEIINRLNMDIESAGMLLDKGFLYMVTYMLRIISGFIGLFYINWKMALCILVCIPVKFILLRILSRKKETLYKDYMKQNQSYFAWMSDRITGIREIKLQNRYRKEKNRFSQKKEKLLYQQQKISLLDICNTSVETVIQGFLTGVYYLLGGYFVCQGSMSVGSILAFISYSGNVTGPVSMLMNIKMLIAQIRPSFQRLEEFWKLDTEQISGKRLEQEFHTLELQEVCFAYDEKMVIKDASMKLQRGQRIAVIGENGSGKSTLIQLLLRFYQPCSGAILINGGDYREIELDEYRSLFSVVSQFPYFFQETIRANLDYEGIYTDEEIIDVFHTAKMEELLEHFPQGLDTTIGVDGTNLSGGEKQKLALIRAILYPAPIVILDENTANFDHKSKKWFFTKGLELFEDKLVMIITHHLEYIKKCDKVYEIKNGKLSRQNAERK